jgi:hypothetical protein
MRVGVGHPVQSLSDVRRTDARSAQICRPNGVARSFQVSGYTVEPLEPKSACNLFSSHDWRAALSDEPIHLGPEVSCVSGPCAASCSAEGLARAGAGPQRSVIRPSCDPGGEAPPSDAGEEVDLCVSSEVVGLDICDAPLINIARRDMPSGDQVPQPGGRERFDFVVVRAHQRLL